MERLWGTLQDRLVAELRLAGATTAVEANAVLERYRPDHNRRFALAPQDVTPAWRPFRRATDLDRVCGFYYEATVLKDNTVRLSGVIIDIPPGPRRRSYAGTQVEVRQFLDGSWRVFLADVVIATAVGVQNGELRAHRGHRRRPPSAASVGKTPVALRAPSVSPTEVIASRRHERGRTKSLSS